MNNGWFDNICGMMDVEIGYDYMRSVAIFATVFIGRNVIFIILTLDNVQESKYNFGGRDNIDFYYYGICT